MRLGVNRVHVEYSRPHVVVADAPMDSPIFDQKVKYNSDKYMLSFIDNFPVQRLSRLEFAQTVVITSVP